MQRKRGGKPTRDKRRRREEGYKGREGGWERKRINFTALEMLFKRKYIEVKDKSVFVMC